MQSVHEIHVDLVRLLAATERLVSVQSPSADGSWEHWPRFCQYITSLDSIQSQLQARVADATRGGFGEDIDTNNNGSRGPTCPSAEDLAEYDRRLENLRRKRDDLVSAAAAAASAADLEALEQQRQASASPDARESIADQGGGDSQGNSSGGRMEQHRKSTTRASLSSSRTSTNNIKNRKKNDRREGGSGGGGGDGLFGGRGPRKAGGEGVGGQAADEAEADQVAQEISSMAGRLKESSMAINQTLRTQTQVLEDTGDAATLNVDRVKRENVRVAERLRKKRAAMFASWCMMITVLAVFFATYALVILPFEKRRGPFVPRRSPTFAQAAEQIPPIPSQQPEGPGGEEEDPRARAEQAYREASRRARSKEQSANAHHRVATAEKEAFRERQAERMMTNAKDRKASMRKKGLERQQAQIEGVQDAQEEHGEHEGLPAGSCSAPPSVEESSTAAADAAAAAAVGSCSAPPPSDEDGDVTVGGMGSCSAPPSDGDDSSAAAAVGSCSAPPSDDEVVTGASSDDIGSGGEPPADDDAESTDARKGAADVTPPALDRVTINAEEEYRRKSSLAYEQRARQEAQRMESSNAGLRLVAEEKERYRHRQAEEMMRKATERKAKALAQKKAREAQQAAASAAPPGTGAVQEEAEDRLAAKALDLGRKVIGDESESSEQGPQVGSVEEDMKTVSDDGVREGTVVTRDGGDDSTAGAGAVGASGDERGGVTMPSAEAREVERRLAEEAKQAYERNSRRTEDTLASQNAGLRLVAEEKEKYRQRQTILEDAKNRRQQKEQQQLEQHGETTDVPGIGESQSSNHESGREKKAGQADEDRAADPSSGGDAGGGGGRGEGLEAIRMRLRESLASKGGGAEGEAGGGTSDSK